MERKSTEHSPRLDDEMAREVASLTHGAPVEARMAEERLLEDAADGEPAPQSLVAGGPAGAESAGGIQDAARRDRTELAQRLRPSIFPASRTEVVACAVEEHGSESLLAALERLPDVMYRTTNDVWVALGGMTESRATPAAQPERAPERAPAPEPPAVPEVERFYLAFDWRYRIAALPLGITPGCAFVELRLRDGVDTVHARFGPWHVETPISNVVDAEISGPYSLPKTIGPPHVSLADAGLTFATTSSQGVCIRFRRAVPGIEPMGLLHHPALTVTVAEPEAFRSALQLRRQAQQSRI